MQADVSRGNWSATQATMAVCFSDYAEQWLVTRKVKGRSLADRTVVGYRDLLDRFIGPTFGHLPVHTITREQVDRWYDRTATDLPTSRAKAYSLLHAILASAVHDDYLIANPARIRGASQVDRAHQIRPATLAELATITAEMPPRYQLMVQLATWCALRFGELTELRRGDIDTKTAVIRVRRGVVCVRGRFIVKAPKSKAGMRDVAIPAALMPAVRAHLLEHTAPGPAGLLFPARHDPDQHLRQSSMARVFYRARAKAGRPDLRFHDLRHTGAVLAARSGATPAELMARLGHSTSSAAMRYQHAADDRDALIAERLSALIEADQA